MSALHERITFDPAVCGGRPCIRGYRLRVKDILDMLAGGASDAEILRDYEFLEAAEVEQAFRRAIEGNAHAVQQVDDPRAADAPGGGVPDDAEVQAIVLDEDLLDRAALGRRSEALSEHVARSSAPRSRRTSGRMAFDAAMARARLSSLNAHRSSSEPPPRARIITSTICLALKKRTASTMSFAAPSPCTRTG